MSIHTPTITATPSTLSHSLADGKFRAVILNGYSAIFLVALINGGEEHFLVATMMKKLLPLTELWADPGMPDVL